ncbi:YcaO-like family protein [Desulfoluna spongiiphila]|uniref:Ribosomal protein S12 methylthiotransferase accessory factor n=1 Tax=Desulfoluna spongiiphila TaxID=419481 RepID=A0A1G5F1H5_9BACT|nr:YcaO-like family protein [Desulfoluna spongiiphila]SCY33096.1 ribosomal protein S12 methylthiotransferase accessory factor [Desulfoluna spongiiphila]
MSAGIVLEDAIKICTTDQDKIISPEETVARFKEKAKNLSLDILKETSRIDNGRLDIPVFFSVCGKDASALTGTAKQMGKGATPEQSEASAVMELAERFSFFAFKADESHFVTDTYANLKDKALPFALIARSVHDDKTPMDTAEAIFSDIPLKWTPARNLTTGAEVLIPFDWFFAINEFNGPSAGNCKEEAICQGISEIVERHVCSLVSHGKKTTPTIDPDTATDPAVRDMLAKYRKNDINLVFSDLSLDTGIPTVGVLAWDPATFPESSELVWTAGTAPDPEKAMSRAMTEVAQLAGDFNTDANYVASGLPKYTDLAEAEFITRPQPDVPLSSLPDLSDANIKVEIERYVAALESIDMEVLTIETTHPELGIPAFYTIIPGAHFRERSLGTSVPMFAARLITEKCDADDALTRITKIEEAVGQRYYLHFYKGQLLLNRGAFDEATAAFEKALSANPDEPEIPSICSWMGVSLKETGRYREALKVLQAGIDIDPEREDIHNLMGFCHYMMADHERAIDAFREVLRLNPNSAIDYANIASNYRELGNTDKAITYYKMALKMDPSIDFARTNLDALAETA